MHDLALGVVLHPALALLLIAPRRLVDLARLDRLGEDFAQAVRVLEEDGRELAQVRRAEGRVHDAALAAVVVALGEEDALAEDHGEVAAHLFGLGVVVAVREENMVERRRVVQDEALRAEKAVVPRDRAVFLLPLFVCDRGLLLEDAGDVAPQDMIPRRTGDVAKGGEVRANERGEDVVDCRREYECDDGNAITHERGQRERDDVEDDEAVLGDRRRETHAPVASGWAKLQLTAFSTWSIVLEVERKREASGKRRPRATAEAESELPRTHTAIGQLCLRRPCLRVHCCAFHLAETTRKSPQKLSEGIADTV